MKRQPTPKARRRTYTPPLLRVHGDFRKLTAAKGGSNNDGSGKPRTRRNGGPS